MSSIATLNAPAEPQLKTDEQLFHRYIRADVVIPILLILITVVVSLVSMVRAPQYSRYDEYTHADYAYRMWVGNVPEAGNYVLPATREDWACRGDMKGALPECGSQEVTNPERFVYNGLQYNYFHPPLYYTVTGYIAGPVSDLLNLSFFTVARMVSTGFLGIGIASVYLAIRSWRVRPGAATAVSMLLLSVAAVMHNGFIINQDSLAIGIGAGTVWVIGQWINRQKVPIWATLALMFVAAASKVILAVPVLLACLVFAVASIHEYRQRNRGVAGRLAWAAVLPFLLMALIYVGWDVIQSHRGDPNFESPMSGLSTFALVGNPIGEWIATIPTRMFGIGEDYWTHNQLDGWGTRLAASVFGIVGTISPFLGLLIFPKWSRQWLMSGLLMVGFIAVPTAVQLQAYIDAHEFFKEMNTRYALTLLPLQMLVVASIIQRMRWERWALWGSAALAMGYAASAFGLLKMM